jgi:hypothetical protein
MASTNARSVPTKSAPIPKSGPALSAGPSFTSAASRNGPRTRAARWLLPDPSTRTIPHRASGGARAAILPKTDCHLSIRAGAAKILTRNPSQEYHHTRAVRHVQNQERCRSSVRILASSRAMQVPARHVHIWDRCRAASVARRHSRGDALRQTMSKDGAADSSAATSCPAVNILALALVTRAFAERAKYR